MSREETNKCLKIVEALMTDPESYEFRVPVDWKGLGLEDYPLLIKQPMDLGTVKQKIKKNKYESANDCISDVDLVWDNCKNL